jgi:hypothetical protein
MMGFSNAHVQGIGLKDPVVDFTVRYAICE